MKTGVLPIVLFAAAAHAATLFDTTPPNGNGDDFTNVRLADVFQLSSAATIDSIVFWYQVDSAVGQQSDLSNVAWAIYDNASGSIGAMIDEGDTTAATCCYDSTNQAYQATISITPTALSAGDYWLELHAGSSLTDDNGGITVWWASSDYSNIYPQLTSSGTELPGIQITTPGYGTSAFQIIGTDDTNATPEPSAILLTISGLAALCLGRRRTR